MKSKERSDETFHTSCGRVTSSAKPHPELTDPNPGIQSKMSEVPAWRQRCLPRCPGQTDKLKSEEEEVREANKWKERQVTQRQKLVCFRGQALYQHPLYPLKEL